MTRIEGTARKSLEREIHRAICDPARYTRRVTNPDGSREPITHWSARAVVVALEASSEFEILADAKEHGTDDPDLARQASVVTRL